MNEIIIRQRDDGQCEIGGNLLTPPLTLENKALAHLLLVQAAQAVASAQVEMPEKKIFVARTVPRFNGDR